MCICAKLCMEIQHQLDLLLLFLIACFQSLWALALWSAAVAVQLQGDELWWLTRHAKESANLSMLCVLSVCVDPWLYLCFACSARSPFGSVSGLQNYMLLVYSPLRMPSMRGKWGLPGLFLLEAKYFPVGGGQFFSRMLLCRPFTQWLAMPLKHV